MSEGDVDIGLNRCEVWGNGDGEVRRNFTGDHVANEAEKGKREMGAKGNDGTFSREWM